MASALDVHGRPRAWSWIQEHNEMGCASICAGVCAEDGATFTLEMRMDYGIMVHFCSEDTLRSPLGLPSLLQNRSS